MNWTKITIIFDKFVSVNEDFNMTVSLTMTPHLFSNFTFSIFKAAFSSRLKNWNRKCPSSLRLRFIQHGCRIRGLPSACLKWRLVSKFKESALRNFLDGKASLRCIRCDEKLRTKAPQEILFWQLLLIGGELRENSGTDGKKLLLQDVDWSEGYFFMKTFGKNIPSFRSFVVDQFSVQQSKKK